MTRRGVWYRRTLVEIPDGDLSDRDDRRREDRPGLLYGLRTKGRRLGGPRAVDASAVGDDEESQGLEGQSDRSMGTQGRQVPGVFEVDEENEAVVLVAIGHKEHEELLIRGKKVQL